MRLANDFVRKINIADAKQERNPSKPTEKPRSTKSLMRNPHPYKESRSGGQIPGSKTIAAEPGASWWFVQCHKSHVCKVNKL